MVLPYVMNIICGVILAVTTKRLNKSNEYKEEEARKQQALADGVEALLRESIVNNYNKYTDKGYCPVYAKESLRRAYSAYHTLNGNDVATELYRRMLSMPDEPPEE